MYEFNLKKGFRKARKTQKRMEKEKWEVVHYKYRLWLTSH